MDSLDGTRVPSAGVNWPLQQKTEQYPPRESAAHQSAPANPVPHPAHSFAAGGFDPQKLSWWNEPLQAPERIGRSRNWIKWLVGAGIALTAWEMVTRSVDIPEGGLRILAAVFVAGTVFKFMDRYWPWVSVSRRTAGQRVFGRAGESLTKGWVPFTRDAVEKGVEGERRTALALEALLRIPGTRIVHGLKFPGSRVADVDHAVLNGDRVVFIDSKFWMPGHYRWDGPSALLVRAPRRTERRTVHMDTVLQHPRIRAVAPNVACRIILHPSRPGAITFAPDGQVSPDGIHATTVQDGVESIGRWLREGAKCGEVDLRTLDRILAMRK